VIVLFCDRHRLLTESLAHVLTSRGHDVLVAASPERALQIAAETAVDVCVMEVNFGTDRLVPAITWLRSTAPPTAVLLLSAIDDPYLLAPLLLAGATGSVSKEAELEVVLDMLTTVASGAMRPPRGIAPRRALLHAVTRSLLDDLTRREREVLDRLVLGEGTAAMATGMGVTYATARTHIQHVLDKLGAHSRLEAVALALREVHRDTTPTRHQASDSEASQRVSA
jgi:two-component system nitrate/nitrite response regulator NarL